MDADPLALSPERMREMGYAVVDMLVARMEALREDRSSRPRRSMRCAIAWLVTAAVRRPARPTSMSSWPASNRRPPVRRALRPSALLRYIPGAGTWPAALGDLIAAATNIDAGSWREAVGPSTLELIVLDWFRDWIEYRHRPRACSSAAAPRRTSAIACAREALIGPMSSRIVMYTGDQTHSSVARAARHLGFRPDQLRVLPTDDAFRLRP